MPSVADQKEVKETVSRVDFVNFEAHRVLMLSANAPELCQVEGYSVLVSGMANLACVCWDSREYA